MAFENKNPPLKSRGLPLVNKSHLLHPLAVLISQIECDRFFEVSASIDIDSYPGSLACELDISIETWVSLIKANGLTSKNRLNNPVVDYKNWCEVLGLEKKKIVFITRGRPGNLKDYMCRLYSVHKSMPGFKIDKTINPFRFSKTKKGSPYEINVAENRRGVVTIKPLSADISTPIPTCKKGNCSGRFKKRKQKSQILNFGK